MLHLLKGHVSHEVDAQVSLRVVRELARPVCHVIRDKPAVPLPIECHLLSDIRRSDAGLD